jgi:long-chain acyl-CoA synthetase
MCNDIIAVDLVRGPQPYAHDILNDEVFTMHLGELVALSAERTPDKAAFIFRDQPTTYREFEQRVNQVANGLLQLGVGKGDRVGLYMHNVPLFMEAYYGAQRIGATIVPLNPLYKPAELAFILNDCEAKVALTLGMFAPVLMAARGNIPSLQSVVVAAADAPAGTVAWRDAFGATATAAPPDPGIGPDDVAVICYTSGTTGQPKGAMLTHRNFISNCTQMNAASRVALRSDDVVWVGLPLFHIYAMNVAMNLAIMVNATMVIMERFDAAGAMELISKHHVTAVHGAPPMYLAWASLPDTSGYDLSSLRYCGSGAAALPVQVLENFRRVFGVDITEGYGLTEAAPVVTTNAAGPISKAGSIGPVVPGVEVQLVNPDTGAVVGVGEVGELLCRGANVMAGYYHRPEATSDTLRDGWLHTGDLATQDEDGYYYIVDRLKDMIIVKGFNVYPREVEELLFRHPAVADAAIVQAPFMRNGEIAGETVFAFVVLKPGMSATEGEIIDYCRVNLADYKVPTRVAFRADLPKNNTGKVLRRELRDEAAKLVTEV